MFDIVSLTGPPPKLRPEDFQFMRRSGQSRYPQQQHDPHRATALRPHVEPPRWEPSVSRSAPTPLTFLLVGSIGWDAPNEPLRVGVARLFTPQGLAQGWVWYPDGYTSSQIEQVTTEAEALGDYSVMSRAEFAELVLHRLLFKYRPALVAWHPQREAERMSAAWTEATGTFRGGHSFIIHTYAGDPDPKHPLLANGEIENVNRSKIRVRSIDSVRALMGITMPMDPDESDKGGRRVIVSIRSLVEAQAGRPLTPGDAFDLYGILRPDAAEGLVGLAAELDALEALYGKAMRLHRVLMPHRPPNPAMSSGSYAQGILERRGATPPLSRQPGLNRGVEAAFAAGYFAGDVGLGARCPDLACRLLDMSGAYAMAGIHAGTDELLVAKRLHHYDRDPKATIEWLLRLAVKLRRWFDGRVDRCPLTAKDFKRLARTLTFVIPNGDMLPHRFAWLDGWRMTIAPLTDDKARPFIAADVLASILRTGGIPTITRVIRVAPWGRQNLQPVTLPTGTVIEASDDTIAVMAIDRARLEIEGGSELERGMLKGMTNSLIGKTGQVNDDEPTSKTRPNHVWDGRDPEAPPFEVSETVIEEPGAWYCPQAAAGVNATARLLLTISRLAFEDCGGTVLYWDTDSLVIAATPSGGYIPVPGGPLLVDGQESIRALSYRQIDRIRWFLEDLSPYPSGLRPTINLFDPDTGLPVRIEEPRFLRVEPENHPPRAIGLPTDGLRTQVVSSKRYDTFLILRPGPHCELTPDGSARTVQPAKDQIYQHSEILIRSASRHGATQQPPAGYPDDSWVDEAVAADLALKLGIQPRDPAWANDPAISLIPVTRPRIGRSIAAAPYSRIASWRSVLGNGTTAITHAHPALDPESAEWFDADTGDAITPNTSHGSASVFGFIGDTYATAIARLRRTSEPTATTPGVEPCNPTTRGIVRPAPTVSTGVALIGRESRRWRNHTPQGRPDQLTYREADTWLHHLGEIRSMVEKVGQVPVADAIGVSERTIRNVLNGGVPSGQTASLVTQWLERRSRTKSKMAETPSGSTPLSENAK
jgi:hypothetical protein